MARSRKWGKAVELLYYSCLVFNNLTSNKYSGKVFISKKCFSCTSNSERHIFARFLKFRFDLSFYPSILLTSSPAWPSEREARRKEREREEGKKTPRIERVRMEEREGGVVDLWRIVVVGLHLLLSLRPTRPAADLSTYPTAPSDRERERASPLPPSL